MKEVGKVTIKEYKCQPESTHAWEQTTVKGIKICSLQKMCAYLMLYFCKPVKCKSHQLR